MESAGHLVCGALLQQNHYCILPNLVAMLLFPRAALFLWIRPLVAARSTVFTASLKACSAASRSPPVTAASNFLILVFMSDLADLFFKAAFCEVSALFDADLILGTGLFTPCPELESTRKVIVPLPGAKCKSFCRKILNRKLPVNYSSLTKIIFIVIIRKSLMGRPAAGCNLTS